MPTPASNPSARLSIILPVLNVVAELEASLHALQPWRARGHELLVVDGGSRDGTVTLARKHADRVLLSGAGGALQKNTGGEYASHDILLFLSVQARLPVDADMAIAEALQTERFKWGHVAWMASDRSALQRMAAALRGVTGALPDAASLFVTRPLFERVKGFELVDSGEDAVLGKRLRQFAQPVRISARGTVQT